MPSSELVESPSSKQEVHVLRHSQNSVDAMEVLTWYWAATNAQEAQLLPLRIVG